MKDYKPDYRPLLVIKMPVGKRTHDRALEDMYKYRDNVVEHLGEEYNIMISATTKPEWEFDGFFATDKQIEEIKKIGEETTKRIIEDLKNGKKKD